MVGEYQEQSRKIKLFLQELLLTDMEVNGEIYITSRSTIWTRALPYIENPNAYHKYEVLKPIDNVTISEIAPAFEQVGGGIQYELPNNIKKLKELDYIKEIK